jgi:hypothetical protein
MPFAPSPRSVLGPSPNVKRIVNETRRSRSQDRVLATSLEPTEPTTNGLIMVYNRIIMSK